MTQEGETEGYTNADHIQALFQHSSSCTSVVVTGITRPVMASTWLIRLTARSKLPEMPLRAARKRLPKL